MNPLALLFTLLGTMGAASALSGGRRRGMGEDTSEQDLDEAAPGARSGREDDEEAAGAYPVWDVVTLPSQAVQTGGTGTDGGTVAPTAIKGETVQVMTGRVRTLAPQNDDVVSLRIVAQPAQGHVSVNPDNTIALVLTETQATGPMSFSYEVTHADGTTSLHTTPLDVTPGIQAKGWGMGDTHYMLEVDENDRVIVEHGETHREVYVSGSETAFSLADIAAREGLAVEQITGGWLAARPHYGSSEGMALAPDAGMKLWNTLTPLGSESSHWLLFERGYVYDEPGMRLITRGASGENELNPLFIGAWGEGEKPEIAVDQSIFQNTSRNIVIQDLAFPEGLLVLDGHNIIFDNVTFRDQVAVQDSSGITIHNSAFYDVHRDVPVTDGDIWEAHANRISGLYVSGTDGLLLEDNRFDLNGWEEGYLEDGSTDGGQSPSMFSHNIYLQWDNDDVTLRDTISMRAASFGVQVRSGGFLEDNLFLDNNAAFSVLGGDYEGKGPVGYYSLVTDNLTTSAGYKVAPMIGALNWGMQDSAELTSLVDNIVAHMADPNNPAEIAAKPVNANGYFDSGSAFYDDTIVWNWGPAENTKGLDAGVLDQTTIQRFTATLLGKPDATIGDLATYLRAQADGTFDDVVDADLIVRFFQAGFGIAPDIRTDAGMLRFIPNEIGDGVRWDNRLNWSSGDLPGSVDGDSVDLGGNSVIFGGTATVGEVEFGPNGALRVEHGKLSAEGGLESGPEDAALVVNGAGQVWTEGGRGTGTLDIDVTGGRLANTGDFRMSADVTASGGQTLLGVDGARYAITNGSRLEIAGDGGEVGFDGEANGISILGIGREGTLAFSAELGALGSIEELRSGALGDAPKVLSGVDLGSGRLEIDLGELVETSGTFTLVDVDELIGSFASTNITGLGGRNAQIVIDYDNDRIDLMLAAGSGMVKSSVVGSEADVDAGEEALWTALTSGRGSYDDPQQAVDDEDFIVAS